MTTLARKWRPKNFSEVVGQNTVVTILENIIATKNMHHAYLLTGTRGVGKTTLARIIAKSLNCTNKIKPCCECSNCISIDNFSFADVIELDAASHTGVDNMREIIENSQYLSIIGKYKVYIIDEAHMLSKSAFNAMLKTLEEPPEHVVFILATTELNKVPMTVLSRCLQLKLQDIPADIIATQLKKILNIENIVVDDDAINELANAADGSMRDALSLTDQAVSFSGVINKSSILKMLGKHESSLAIEFLSAIVRKDAKYIIQASQDIQNFQDVLINISARLFDIAVVQLTDENNHLFELAKKISVQDCQLYFDITNLAIAQIKNTCNKYQLFVMTMLRMIAFCIGSNNEKEVFIQSHNFNIIKQKTIQFNWMEFVKSLNLNQLDVNTALIIKNTDNLCKFSDEQLELTVVKNFYSLIDQSVIRKLEHLIFLFCKIKYNIAYIAGDVIQSISTKEESDLLDERSELEISIQNDQVLSDLRDNFSAKIIPNSIKKR